MVEIDKESKYQEALTLYKAKDYDQAHEVLKAVFNNAAEDEQSSIIAKSLYLRGFIYYLQNNSRLAYSDYLRAIEIADVIGDEKMISRLNNEIGQIFFENELYQQALTYFQFALKFSDAATVQDRAYYYFGVGKSLRMLGRFDEGMDALLQAIEINENLRNNDALAGDYVELGKLQDGAGNIELSFEHYNTVIKIAYLTNNPNKYLWLAHNNIGKIALKSGDYDLAQRNLELALSYNVNKEQLWVTYNNLGRVFNERGEYVKAWECFKRSLAYNSEKGEMNELAITNQALKKTFEMLEQPDSLLHYSLLINDMALPMIQTKSWLKGEDEKIALLTKYQDYVKQKSEQEQYAKTSWLMAFIMTFIFMSGVLSVRLWKIYHYKSAEKGLALIKNSNEMVYLLDMFRKEKEEMKKSMDQKIRN
ncbi:MAG: hypothetical protein ABJO02_02965 [Reichenbachiella sp.]|uniref:tetratricopeptide repeat protein n=1 Tax=Reichenbachiella sp. TaxID=2184521 RepID=UPI003297FBF3